MASVTQLADRVCSVTGLSDSGDDRALVLGYLNQAYAYSVLEAQGYQSSFSKALTAGTADYTIGTAPLDVTDIVELRTLWVSDSSGQTRVLQQIPEVQILSLRQGVSASGVPLFYAMRGTRQLLLHPAPQSGVTLAGSYLASPPELVESGATTGQETTPTAIPAAFHMDILANKAIALAMEYDNRFEEAASYDAKWSTAMERLISWVSRFGGPSVGDVADVGYNGPRDMI